MNDDKLFQLLNNLDDDLIEKEVDKLLEGVEIDMNSIKKKAERKLKNKNKKSKYKRRLPYIAAACICLLTITTVYADDISQAIKSFFNKTPVYSTIVDGDAYYLKDEYELSDDIKLTSIMVSEGELKMDLITNLTLEELGEINIIPKNNPETIYFPGGYGEEENEYTFLFMNKNKNNYDIKPFKDFELKIAEKTYDVSLEKAKSIDSSSEIYTAKSKEKNIEGINIGARRVEGDGKTKIQIITSFANKGLELTRFGMPIKENTSVSFERLEGKGTIGSGGDNRTHSLYVLDKANNKYKLEIPKDSKGRPVTIFETDVPKDKELTLEIPAITAYYNETIEELSLDIPKKDKIELNKEIDLNIQKAILKSIKRTSPTSAEIEFEMNTGDNENINIRDFDFYSKNIKKIYTNFDNKKAIMNIEFDRDIKTADIQIGYPHFVINGDWTITVK